MSTTTQPKPDTITVLYDGFTAAAPAAPTITPGLYVVPAMTRHHNDTLIPTGAWTVVHATGYCVPHLHDIIDYDDAHHAAARLTQIDWTDSADGIQAQTAALPPSEREALISVLRPFAASHNAVGGEE